MAVIIPRLGRPRALLSKKFLQRKNVAALEAGFHEGASWLGFGLILLLLGKWNFHCSPVCHQSPGQYLSVAGWRLFLLRCQGGRTSSPFIHLSCITRSLESSFPGATSGELLWGWGVTQTLFRHFASPSECCQGLEETCDCTQQPQVVLISLRPPLVGETSTGNSAPWLVPPVRDALSWPQRGTTGAVTTDSWKANRNERTRFLKTEWKRWSLFSFPWLFLSLILVSIFIEWKRGTSLD